MSEKDDVKWIEELPWEDFLNSGLLWFVNNILHVFGRAFVFEFEEDEIKRVYFARCRCRGFTEECEREGFSKIYGFLKSEIEDFSSDMGIENEK